MGWYTRQVRVLLPLAVRRSKLYQAIIGRLLRITIELVGGVEGVYPAQEMPVRELLVRKTAGNVVELGSIVAVGLVTALSLAGLPTWSGVRKCTCGRWSLSYGMQAYWGPTRTWRLFEELDYVEGTLRRAGRHV